MLAHRKKFFFEKWYYDAQADDGTFLFVYFAGITLMGRRSGQVVVSLTLPDGRTENRSCNFKRRQIDIADDRTAARFGDGELLSGASPSTFTLSAPEISLDLAWRSPDPAWIPGEDGVLLRRKRRALVWTVPVPCAQVTANVRVGDLEAQFAGLGYHDFVQTDIPPWRVPLRELLWGRALGPEGAVVWNRPTFAGADGEYSVELGWAREGARGASIFSGVDYAATATTPHPDTGDSYPSEMTITMLPGEEGGEAVRFSLGKTRLFLGDNVADVAGFRGRVERWLYRKFTGNPVEYKLLSGASGTASLEGALAAHERVVWGRGRKG